LSKRRFVITGLGLVCPLGSTVADAWSALLRGESGIGPITRFDVSAFPVRFSGAVRGFDLAAYLPPKEARRIDPFMHYGIAAGVQAMGDAGLDLEREDRDRIAVVMGAGIGGLSTIESEHSAFLGGGVRKISPFYIPGSIINMLAGHLSIRFGLRGPNLGVVTACTTSTHALGLAARCIQYGDADIVLSGGAEMGTTPTAIGGFAQAKALSTRNDEPTKASRPWDRDRDGFVLGEGAGVLVLEEYEHAKARGATIYAEMAGFGMSGDAHHITAPPDDGAGAVAAMRNALRDAGLPPSEIQYINAHGTSTPQGDLAETHAIKTVFGANTKVAVHSTKSMIGHLLGAAGAVEAIFTILSIDLQKSPATINLDHPGEGCDLDYVPGTPRDIVIEHALSNSFGFGGTNGTLIFKKAP
jgi:3-oxoacyl-[acyl-carrier-protein] synthase II